MKKNLISVMIPCTGFGESGVDGNSYIYNCSTDKEI